MDELTALSNELALMKRQFDKRCGVLETRLEQHRRATLQKTETKIESMQIPQAQVQIQPKVEPLVIKPNPKQKLQPQSQSEPEVKPKLQTKPQAQPSRLSQGIAWMFNLLTSLLVPLLAAFVAMIVSWASPFIALYDYYKSRNMLATFTLMVAGVGFTVAGFGYLLQLIIGQSGAIGKVIGLGLGAIAVSGFGCLLLTKTRFSEFASSIIALGLLLGFTTIYFAGSVYQLIDASSTLLAYLLVAMGIHVVVHLTGCQWLTCLSIVGVCALPLFDINAHFNADWYLVSVGIVAASCLFAAFKKSQLWLVVVTLASVVTALELLIVAEQAFNYLVIYELLYGMFFAYVAISLFLVDFEKVSQKNNLLVITATFVVSFLAIMAQLYPMVGSSSLWIMVLNVSLALVLAFVGRNIFKQAFEVLVVIAAVWAIGAILVYFEQAQWGLVWAIEGLALLWLGKRFNSSVIAVKAQVLVFAALIYCIGALAPFYPAPAFLEATGVVLAVSCVLICTVWRYLLGNIAHKLIQALMVLETLLVTLLLVGLVEAWFSGYSPLIIPLLQVAILWRAKQARLRALEYIVMGLLAFTGFEFALAGIDDLNWFFVDLSWSGRATLISLGLQLWWLAACYRTFYKEGKLITWAEKSRSALYLLLPVCWVAGAANSLQFDVLAVLWLSPLLALLVAKRFDDSRVDNYAFILLVACSAVFMLFINLASFWVAFCALAGFGMVFLACYYLELQKHCTRVAQRGSSFGYFVWGLMVCHFIVEHLNLPIVSLLFASVYFGIGLFDSKLIPLFERNYHKIVLVNAVIYIFAWFSSLFEREYGLVPLVGLALMAVFKYSNRGCELCLRVGPPAVKGKVLLHLFIAISYSSFLISFVTDTLSLWLAPCLIIHGVMMLFVLHRQAINLKASFGLMGLGVAKLIVFDVNAAMLSHKVMLFMGLGIFVLFASWSYQRMLVKFTEN